MYGNAIFNVCMLCRNYVEAYYSCDYGFMTCPYFSLSLIAVPSCNFSKPLGLTSAGGCAAWPSSGAACNKFPTMSCRNFLKNVLENQKLFSIQQINHSFAKQSHAYKLIWFTATCTSTYDEINLSS